MKHMMLSFERAKDFLPDRAGLPGKYAVNRKRSTE